MSSSIKITFNGKEDVITINDEAKTLQYFYKAFIILQLFATGLQVYSRWGEFSSVLFYVFCFLFIAFIGFGVLYFYKSSYQKTISFNDIKYYKESPFLFSKLRYFKLKNNKIRFVNFSSKSGYSKDLMALLHKYQISINS